MTVIKFPAMTPYLIRRHARHPLGVMRGLDPRIHDANQRIKTLRLVFVEAHHGLPGQARQ
jgi:hypothetical protein